MPLMMEKTTVTLIRIKSAQYSMGESLSVTLEAVSFMIMPNEYACPVFQALLTTKMLIIPIAIQIGPANHIQINTAVVG